MPKHSMHCTPDLVTVLPRWFILQFDVVVVLSTGWPQSRGSVPLMTCLTCAYSFEDVCGVVWCAWLPGRQSKTNQIPQKKKNNKANTTAVEVEVEFQIGCCNSVGSLLSVLLWCVVSHFKNMNGVTCFFFLNGEFMWCITRYITYTECFI